MNPPPGRNAACARKLFSLKGLKQRLQAAMGKVIHKKSTPALPPALRTAIKRFVREEYLGAWLSAPTELLGGKTPNELLASGQEERIWKALNLAQKGEGS